MIRSEDSLGLRMAPVIRRLEAFHALGPHRDAALAGLSGPATTFAAGDEIHAEGASGLSPRFVVRGWAAAQRVIGDRLQIFRLILPGDLVGLEGGRGPPGWSVAALTPLETVSAVPLRDEALNGATGLARAFALSVRQEERMILEHLIWLGRLNARERVAHLLLELRERLETVGLGDDRRFPLPISQETIGCVLGMSAVHVNRVLSALRKEGILELRAGTATVRDPEALATLAGRAPEAPPNPRNRDCGFMPERAAA